MICGESVETEYEEDGKTVKKLGYTGYNCKVLERLDLDRQADK